MTRWTHRALDFLLPPSTAAAQAAAARTDTLRRQSARPHLHARVYALPAAQAARSVGVPILQRRRLGAVVHGGHRDIASAPHPCAARDEGPAWLRARPLGPGSSWQSVHGARLLALRAVISSWPSCTRTLSGRSVYSCRDARQGEQAVGL